MELSEGFMVRCEKGVWRLEHAYLPGTGAALICTFDGCGDAQAAAYAAARYLADVAKEINKIARNMPADETGEEE